VVSFLGPVFGVVAIELPYTDACPWSAGGRAGSQSLNQTFSQAVANLVGDDQWPELKKSKGFALAERQFDREIKKAFQGSPSEEYHVNFPMTDFEDDPDSNLDSNTWTMTG
jgi:hypothetical protein